MNKESTGRDIGLQAITALLEIYFFWNVTLFGRRRFEG
jgi:hypothetical protein